jgi:hypothetical protein
MKHRIPLIFYISSVLLLFSLKLKCQPGTFYFMKGIPQTKDLNPAKPGISEGFYFGMPGLTKLDFSINTNGWNYSDLVHKGRGSKADSLVVDLNNFTSTIGEANFLDESAGLTFLEGGLKSGRNFFAISFSEKEVAEIYFHRNLIELINHGNYPYIGTSFRSDAFGIDAQHYRELAFNYSREMNKKLSLGFSAKILFGLGTIHTNRMNLSVASPPTGNYLDLTASGKVDISAPVDFNFDSSGHLKSVTDNFVLGQYLVNFGNPGLSMDFGISYRVNKKLELSGSLVDFGMISWNDHTIRLNELGQFRYRGIMMADPSQPSVTDVENFIRQVGDSINDEFILKKSAKGFATMLPVKLYMGGEFLVNDRVSLGGLARVRAYNNFLRASLTASANAFIGRGFSLTGSYSVMESTFDNLGAGIGFRGGPLQIYAASDNIFSPFNPGQAKNLNLRLGINFIFDQNQKDKRGTSKSGKKECGCPYK